MHVFQNLVCFIIIDLLYRPHSIIFVKILFFVIFQPNPDQVLKILNALGIDAYRGATQLNLIEPENGNTPLAFLHKYLSTYPHEAKYLLDHVIYLPVNKLVPFHDLDQICAAVDIAVAKSDSSVTQLRRGTMQTKVKLTSKL